MPYNLDIKGWMSESELQVIEQWASTLPENSHVVEIGSFYGRSTYCWAASMHPSSTLYCYDQWVGEVEQESVGLTLEHRIKLGYPIPGDKNTYENFKENIKMFANITATRVYDSSMINWQGADVDIVFIDAAHRNPIDWDYITYWLPKIKKGGFICGHDYNAQFADVNQNVQQLEILLNKPVETFAGSLWRFFV